MKFAKTRLDPNRSLHRQNHDDVREHRQKMDHTQARKQNQIEQCAVPKDLFSPREMRQRRRVALYAPHGQLPAPGHNQQIPFPPRAIQKLHRRRILNNRRPIRRGL
jgi:hypothetical protein